MCCGAWREQHLAALPDRRMLARSRAGCQSVVFWSWCLGLGVPRQTAWADQPCQPGCRTFLCGPEPGPWEIAYTQAYRGMYSNVS